MLRQAVAWRPRLRSGCTIEAAQRGWLVRHRAAERPLLIDEQQREMLELLDGQRTFEEIAIEWCRERHTTGLRAFLALLANLREAGLLQPTGDDADPGEFLEQVVPTGDLRRAVTWRRSSEILRSALPLVGAPLAPVFRVPALAVLLALVALTGAVLWAISLSADPVMLLHGGDSYFTGLLYLLALNLLLSLLGAIGSSSAHRAVGLPAGGAMIGLVAGLPAIWIAPTEDASLGGRRRLWLHLAGPLLEALAGTVALVLALYYLPSYRQPLLIACTVAYLRLFAALCPFVESPLTRAVSGAVGLPNLRNMAMRLIPRRIWTVLTDPSDHPRLWSGIWALAMLLWTALALQLVSLLLAPQLPALITDLAGGLPPQDALVAVVVLTILVALSVGMMLLLGIFIVVALGRWIAEHPIWSHPAHQLLALLAVILIGVGGLTWIVSTAPDIAWPVAAGMAIMGALCALVGAAVLMVEHRGGRVTVVLIPAVLAALLAGALALLLRGVSGPVPDALCAGLSLMIALFLFGWIALIWRRPAGYVGAAVSIGLIAAAFFGSAAAAEASLALCALTAATALAMLGLQVHTHLVRSFLLVAVAALVPISVHIATRLDALPSLMMDTGFAAVALLIAAMLLHWAWVLWSVRIVSDDAPLETAGTWQERLSSILLATFSRFAGPSASMKVDSALSEDPAEAADRRLALVLARLRQDLGSRLTERIALRACQLLPWLDYLAAVEHLDLVATTTREKRWSRDELIEVLTGTLAFAHLNRSEIGRLVDHASIRGFADGEPIISEGEPAHWLHVMLQGSARLIAPRADGSRTLTLLRSGQTFGLDAMSERASASVTVRADGCALTIAIHQVDLLNSPGAAETKRRITDLMDGVRSLRSASIFHELAEAQVAGLLASAARVHFAPGEALVRQGEPGALFFIIQSGRVEVTRETADGPRVLAQLGPGKCVGELALLLDLPRTATVTAETDVETLALGREDFLRIFPPDDPGTQPLLRLSLTRVLELDPCGNGPETGGEVS